MKKARFGSGLSEQLQARVSPFATSAAVFLAPPGPYSMRSDSGSGRPSFHPEPFRASWRGSHSLTYGNTHTHNMQTKHTSRVPARGPARATSTYRRTSCYQSNGAAGLRFFAALRPWATTSPPSGLFDADPIWGNSESLSCWTQIELTGLLESLLECTAAYVKHHFQSSPQLRSSW